MKKADETYMDTMRDLGALWVTVSIAG
jgi:hypothetical protein